MKNIIQKTIHPNFHKWIILLVGTLLFYSCKNSEGTPINQNYRMDTIHISIGDSCLQTYTSLRNRIYGDKLYCFNTMQYTIDIFNLSTLQLFNQIKIEREGVNGIPHSVAFNVYGDSIFIQNETHYIIINHQDKIIKKISRDKLNSLIDQKKYSILPTNITLSNFEDLIFDKHHNELIIPTNITDPFNLDEKYCIATINIEKESVNILPIDFPSIVKNKYYGKLAMPQILSKGDSIILNFPNSSNIYVYNRTDRRTLVYDIKSCYTPNLSESLEKNANRKKLFDHYLHSLFFHNIQFDKYRNLYYRIHTDKSNDPSAFNEKETFLTIINSDFEKVEEIKLPSNTYPIYNIAPSGLIFAFMKGLKEDYFSYANLTNPIIKEIEYTVDELNIPIEKEIAHKDTSSQKKKTHLSKSPIKRDIMTTEKIGDFVKENMIYPKEELEQEIEGYVFIILRSDSSGNVISYEISETATTTDNKNFREEALRVAHLIKQVYPDITFCFHVPFLINRYYETHPRK